MDAGRRPGNRGVVRRALTYELQFARQAVELLAGSLALIPTFDAGLSGPFSSPVVKAKWGGFNLQNAVQIASKIIQMAADYNDYEAKRASILAGYERRMDDWKFQKELAEKERFQIDQQILAAEIRIVIVKNDLDSHNHQIDNAKAIHEFLRSKFTTKELYEWMKSQTAQVYLQSYQRAYDLAKQAEKALQYELGIENSSYIQPGYWDNLKKGLMAGEKLQHDLRKLEQAYVEKNRRGFEITKNISLLHTNPLALIELKETGACTFKLPEEIFDLDYPGHFFRRIKMVSVSIPCIAGPNTTISCTVRLLRNTVRINTEAGKMEKDSYIHNHDEKNIWTDDSRFRDYNVPITAIATSNAQNDDGMFNLDFRDERYLPFEGAGVISEWQIEMMADKALRQFDYNTISDVILHLSYTAREDAGLFKEKAIEHLRNIMLAASQNGGRPLLRLFSLRHEFTNEWHRFVVPDSEDAANTMDILITKGQFPFYARGKTITIDSVKVFGNFKEDNEYTLTMQAAGIQSAAPETDPQYGGLKIWHGKNGLGALENGPLHLKMTMKQDDSRVNPEGITDLFLFVSYTLTDVS